MPQIGLDQSSFKYTSALWIKVITYWLLQMLPESIIFDILNTYSQSLASLLA